MTSTSIESGSGPPAVSAPPTPGARASASATATPSVKPTVVKDLSALSVTPTTVGKEPKVTGKWPLAIEKTTVKVLTPGSGAAVAKGTTVSVNYQGVNARDGKVFDSSWKNKKPVTFSLKSVVAGFTKAIESQKVGSRVLVMMTSQDGYADGQPSAGIQKGDNLVFTIDILGQTEKVAPKAGLPTVTDDAKGAPSITKPAGKAHAACRTEAWVKPITVQDIWRRMYAANLAGGYSNFVAPIANAGAPLAQAGPAGKSGQLASAAFDPSRTPAPLRSSSTSPGRSPRLMSPSSVTLGERRLSASR